MSATPRSGRLLVSCFLLLAVALSAPPTAFAQSDETPQDSECCFYRVGGKVYFDQNANGFKEASEPPLAGWTVEVLNASFVVVGSTLTDANGDYIFTVPVGCGATYYVREVLQSGWTQTAPVSPTYHTGFGTGCSNTIYGPYDFGNTQPGCQGLTVTYTLNSEFNQGTLNGAAATTDQLELLPNATPWQFAWIANASEGTISKVDTQTGKEVGRYYTGPPDSFSNFAYLQPSRTVIDKDGNCWVANRTMGDFPSVTQILTSGGDDRNTNSTIETSTDLNNNGVIDPSELLPWGQDERIVRHYLLGSIPNNEARGMVIDKMGFLWVGLSNSQTLEKVNPNLPTAIYNPTQTPSFAPSLVSLFTGYMPYGLALSPDGYIYQSTIGPNALQIDPGLASGGTAAGPAVTEYITHGGTNYGIAVDQNCKVWIALYSGPNGEFGCVRWDPPLTAGNPLLGWQISQTGAAGWGRGITVDLNNDVWMATNDILSTNSVTKFGNTVVPTFLGNYPTTAPQPVGVGIASDGNLIVTPNAGSTWCKVNVGSGLVMPLAGPQLAGFGPYTYSDFTGSQANMTGTQQGTWTVVTDGGSSSIAWNLITWNGLTPATTGIQVEARVAQTLPALNAAIWQIIGAPGPVGPIPGRYIETRVRLQRFVECGQPFVSPILYDLTVAAICDSCAFVGCPPDTVVPCMTPEGAEVFYPTPVLSALCDSTYQITCTPPSGTFFPMGSTAVHCIAVNAANDTIECVFQVTVAGDCDPDPTGACCVGNVCYQVSEAQCEIYGGIYFGDNTSCVDGCNQNCAEPPNNLVGWWPLNPTASNVTPNLAGSATNGTFVNGPTPVPGQVVDGSYAFNGVNQSVHVPHHASLNLGSSDFTLDAWVKTTSASGVASILDKRSSGNIQGFALFLYDGYPSLQIAVGNVWSNYILTAANGGAPAFVADGNWHLVAVTVDRDDPTGVQFYVDGSPVGLPFDPTARQGNLNNNDLLYIAERHPLLGGGYFAGSLDEVEIARRELRADEILAIYSAGASGKCPEACYATQSIPCCNGLTASSSITICNYDVVSHVYSWGVTPNTTAAGCAPFGPTGFSPASGTVTVPAQGCVTIPISIACPSNIAIGQNACYQVSVFNHDTGRLFGCTGSVRRAFKWCIRWIELDPVPVGGIIPVIAGTAKSIGLEIGLLGDQPNPAVLDYVIQPVAGHHGDPSEALALGGLPPGAPQFGQLALDPGQTVPLQVDVSYQDEYPVGYDRLVLMGDEDGDGVTEALAEVALRSVSGTPLDATDEIVEDRGGPRGRLLLTLPNPFAPSNRITFRVDGDHSEKVKLRLFDLSGRSVKIFHMETELPPGEHAVTWDTRDDRGGRLPAGIYFLRLELGKRTVETAKVLIRP